MGNKSDNVVNENISIIMVGKNHRICEMVEENIEIDVPVDPRIDIDTITADDPDPKFVNVEVIRAGISGNNRRYNNHIVDEINQLVPGCQGFFGHPDPSKYGFEFREPQCIYVGSVVETMADGLKRCIAKAYLFKTSPLREWIPKSIAAGNPMTVSINGSADLVRNGDVLELVHMTDLQSIDWANPGTEGMETSKAMSVVKEMNNNKGGNIMEGNNTAQDIIRNATVEEFRAFNPNGYENMIKGLTVQELQSANPELVNTIISENKVTEMNFTIGGKEESVKVTELQGKFDAYENEIAKLKDDINTAKLDAYKTKKITEMVGEKYVDTFMKRVSGNSEQEIDASIESEIQFVREMGGMNGINNKPVGRNTQNINSDDVKSAVLDMFRVKEDK